MGLAGVVLPLLPTTPFLLLSAYCFGRSSKRAQRWLFENRAFGPYIRSYIDGSGLPWRVRAAVIALLWVTITASVVLAVDAVAVRIVLLVIAVAVTVHVAGLRSRAGKRSAGRDAVQTP